MQTTPFEVARQGDKKKVPTPVRVEFLTREQVLALASGARVPSLLNNGRLGEVTITSIRRWKRDPNRVEFHVKYGMYEFAVFTLDQALMRFVREAGAS